MISFPVAPDRLPVEARTPELMPSPKPTRPRRPAKANQPTPPTQEPPVEFESYGTRKVEVTGYVGAPLPETEWKVEISVATTRGRGTEAWLDIDRGKWGAAAGAGAGRSRWNLEQLPPAELPVLVATLQEALRVAQREGVLEAPTAPAVRDARRDAAPAVQAERFSVESDDEALWFTRLSVQHPTDAGVRALLELCEGDDADGTPALKVEGSEGGESTLWLSFAHMDWLLTVAAPALRAEAVRLGLWKSEASGAA